MIKGGMWSLDRQRRKASDGRNNGTNTAMMAGELEQLRKDVKRISTAWLGKKRTYMNRGS